MFKADKGHGGCCLDRCTENRTGVSVQPGGDIERQNGRGMRVHRLNGVAPSTADLPFQTRAEDGIDQQVGANQIGAREGQDRYIGGLGIPPGGLSITVQLLWIGQRQH